MGFHNFDVVIITNILLYPKKECYELKIFKQLKITFSSCLLFHATYSAIQSKSPAAISRE